MKLAMTGIAALTLSLSASQVAAADGKAVYDKHCAACHKAMPTAPKLGDKAKWGPLIKKGSAALTATVMKGKPPMPPKGGAKNEAEVKAAVQYMIDAAK